MILKKVVKSLITKTLFYNPSHQELVITLDKMLGLDPQVHDL